MSRKEAYNQILKKVRAAHFRHLTLSFLVAFLQSLFYAAFSAGMVAGVLTLTPWAAWREETAWILLVLCFPASVILFWMRIQKLETTALLADRHLRLKEKISSALELGRDELESENDRDWQHALLTDAHRAVQQIDIKKAFPWVSPPEFRWLWAPALVLLLTVYILPQWDVLTGQGTAQAKNMSVEKIEKDLANMMQRQLVFERRAQEEKNQQAAQLAKEMKELSESLKKSTLQKRDALAQMSSLENKWQERKDQLESGMPNLKQSMSQSQTKMAQQLEQALKEGSFAKAAEAMQNIQKQLKTESLDEETRKKLAEDMKKLSEMMGDEMPMSLAMSNASKFLSSSDLGESLKAMQLAEMDLKDLQDLLEQMKLLEEAMEEMDLAKCKLLGLCPNCKSGNCKGGKCAGLLAGTRPWAAGDSRKQGNGMGGPGIGRGGRAPFEDGDVGFESRKLGGQMNEGPLLGIFETEGPANRGESNIDMANVILEARQSAEDALTDEHIPASRRNQVRAYFDSLEEQTLSEMGAGE